jgi:hypothetical protein
VSETVTGAEVRPASKATKEKLSTPRKSGPGV